MTKSLHSPSSETEGVDPGATYRHRRRGTSYTVLGKAILQSTRSLSDEQELVIYVGPDGRLWARPTDEFYDGRFEKIESEKD